MNIQSITASTTMKNYSKNFVSSQQACDSTKKADNLNLGTSNYNVLFQGTVPLTLDSPLSKKIIEKVTCYSKYLGNIKEAVAMTKPVLIKDGDRTISVLVNRFPCSKNTQTTIKLFKEGNEKEVCSLNMSLSLRGKVLEAALKDSSGIYKYSESKCGLEQYIDYVNADGRKQRFSYRNGIWRCIRQDDSYCNKYLPLDFKGNPLAEIFTNITKKGISVFK